MTTWPASTRTRTGGSSSTRQGLCHLYWLNEWFDEGPACSSLLEMQRALFGGRCLLQVKGVLQSVGPLRDPSYNPTHKSVRNELRSPMGRGRYGENREGL